MWLSVMTTDDAHPCKRAQRASAARSEEGPGDASGSEPPPV
jgi:hypothetical protein